MSLSLQQIPFELWRRKSERKGIRPQFKPVFTSYIGVENQVKYNDVLATIHSKIQDNPRHTIFFDGEILLDADFNFINAIKNELANMDVTHLSKQDITLFENSDLNHIFLNAFEYVVNLAIRQENFLNDSVRNNFICKLLLYAHLYIQNLDYSELDFHANHCFYYGDISRHDIYFLILLYIMGFDVVYINPLRECDYWKEIEAYLDWAEYHCYSTMTLCWGAQAALYHYYGVNKTVLPAKMFGIFPYGLTVKNHPLLRGFDDRYFIPQSRHSAVDDDAIDACKALQVLSRSVENGINICATKDLRRIFVLGHFEYDRYTLADEYFRDKKKNLPIEQPKFYFPEGDTTQEPVFKWRSYAHLFYMNWLNIVYQDTPYDLQDLAPADNDKLNKALDGYNKMLLQLQRMGADIQK